MKNRILTTILCLFVCLWEPVKLRANEPTLEQTIEWLKERLVGHDVESSKIKNVKYKDGWLYLEARFEGNPNTYAVALSSLDAQALSRLEKISESTAFTICATGKWPIQDTFWEGGREAITNQKRAVLISSLGGRETALKLAKAFDHAARLSGGGQKDLF